MTDDLEFVRPATTVKFDHVSTCPVCHRAVVIMIGGIIENHSVPDLIDLSDGEFCSGSGLILDSEPIAA